MCLSALRKSFLSPTVRLGLARRLDVLRAWLHMYVVDGRGGEQRGRVVVSTPTFVTPHTPEPEKRSITIISPTRLKHVRLLTQLSSAQINSRSSSSSSSQSQVQCIPTHKQGLICNFDCAIRAAPLFFSNIPISLQLHSQLTAQADQQLRSRNQHL